MLHVEMQRAFAPPKLLCREAMGPMHGLRTIELVVSSPLSGGGHSFFHGLFDHLQPTGLGEVLGQTKKIEYGIYARMTVERLIGLRRRFWARLQGRDDSFLVQVRRDDSFLVQPIFCGGL